MKRNFPWSAKMWDRYGGVFIAMPGGTGTNQRCLVANNATGAWGRFVGWDATCFMTMQENLFFGTQGGVVMQGDRTGYDDGKPYVATLVGGWEMFQQPSAMIVWHQARAIFKSSFGAPFTPQLSATTDFVVRLPPAPPAGPDPGLQEVWDQGLWDDARWDQASTITLANRNTMWVSIGQTGFTHAPIVQVTVAQQARPEVELIAIAATFERGGINV